MTEETFGPVAAIMAVDSDAEALRLMNDSQYGLVSLHTSLLADGRPLPYGPISRTTTLLKYLTALPQNSKPEQCISMRQIP